jgi:YesN/AraC family two-component response regulator
MKSLLIVEDEKMIRRGIRTMVSRSGVPVERIIECGNGEDALEILKTQQIDVMLTDIRMPKMDGIELVQQVSRMENRPLIAAISGYDDFSYAVEMLRNGVKEYILKPVEREKLTEVLKKMDQMLQNRQEEEETQRQIGRSQIRYVLMNQDVGEAELAAFEQKYSSFFYEDGFVICIYGVQARIEEREQITVFDEVCDGGCCIMAAESLSPFLINEIPHSATGISAVHHGIRELKTAFQEAKEARKCAFCQREPKEYGAFSESRIPEGLREQAGKLLEEQAKTQRMQLIGTDKTEELIAQWHRLFAEVEKERISVDSFLLAQQEFLDSVVQIYRNSITDEDQKTLDRCRHVLSFENLEEYENYFMDWVLELHERINDQMDNNRNQQKMKKAVDYIQQNFNQDLNMAVVSNYISMNYSMFSYAFKQFTGTNFVNYLKDIRIREAKKLLADTDMRVVEISRAVGYDNEKNFMKIFKNTCGVSPSEYRKNMQRDV